MRRSHVPRSPGSLIGEPEDDGGKDEKGEEGSDDERQRPVVFSIGRSLSLEPSRRARPSEAGNRRFGFASIPARCSSSSLPSTATRSPGSTGWSRPGHWAISPPSPRHDRHRGQVAEMPPKGRVVGALGLAPRPTGPPRSAHLPARCRVSCGPSISRRRRVRRGRPHRGRCPSPTPSRGLGHGGIGQLGDYADVGAKLADSQGGLQGMDLLTAAHTTATASAKPASTRASPR